VQGKYHNGIDPADAKGDEREEKKRARRSMSREIADGFETVVVEEKPPK
jgi:hypothetical protein